MIKKNIISVTVALVIMYLSLSNANTFDKVSIFNFPFMDKIVHFGMYFALMSSIIFENRKSFKNLRGLLLAAPIPLLYGILMEILQSTITVNRSGSVFDVLANSVGIIVSVLVWLWVKPLIMKETVR